MKRILFAVLLLVLLGSAGCTNTPQTGISHVGKNNDKTCYTIIMTEAEREHYFTTADPVNKSAVMHYGKTDITVVYWCSVSGGGYIPWIGNRVRYMPENFTETEANTAASTLTRDSSAMSIQAAD